MRQSIWLVAALAALVMLISAPAGVGAPTACPTGYESHPVTDDPSYGAVDKNKSGSVCVQLVPKKGAAPRVVDDHVGKK
jgi:hypothetical protein